MAQVRTLRRSTNSVRSLAVVLLLALLLYVFLSGRKKKKGSNSNGRYGQSASANSVQDGARHPSRSDGSDSKNKRENKSGQSQTEDEWASPESAPPISAAPDTRKVKAGKSVLRKRDKYDNLPPSANTSSGSSVRWTDEEGVSPHPATQHRQKWANHVGTTDDSQSEYKHRPKWDTGPKYMKDGHVLVNPEEWAVDKLARHGKLDEPLLKMMKEAEEIGKAKREDGRWQEACEDQWDEDLGPVPAVAMKMALEFSKQVDRKMLVRLQEILDKRPYISGKMDGYDKRKNKVERSFPEFLDNLQIPNNRNDFLYKLILAWYCDTYRCKIYTQRMRITDVPIPMTTDPVAGTLCQILGWMEYLGTLNIAQRLFVGLDLYGLAMRVQVMEEGDEYRLDLTVFMSGGPVHERVKKYGEHYEWCLRLEHGAKASRSVSAELLKLRGRSNKDQTISSLFTRRRLIFRPGWTVMGVGKTEPKPNRSTFQRKLITRPPRVIEFLSAEDVKKTIPGILQRFQYGLSSVIPQFTPQEVCFQSIRQFAWDDSSVTKENTVFNKTTFWMAWTFVGVGILSVQKDPRELPSSIQSNDFVQFVDLGGYIPILRSKPPKLAPLDHFPALEIFILPYVPLGQEGATAELILNPNYGLSHFLAKERKQTHHRQHLGLLKLFVSLREQKFLDNFLSDLDKTLTEIGQKMFDIDKSHEKAVILMRDLARTHLQQTYTVDESGAGTTKEGKWPRGMPLNYDPTRPERILFKGVSVPVPESSNPQPPSEEEKQAQEMRRRVLAASEETRRRAYKHAEGEAQETKARRTEESNKEKQAQEARRRALEHAEKEAQENKARETEENNPPPTDGAQESSDSDAPLVLGPLGKLPKTNKG
ncbi:hypothetical protein L204_101487 [Cryptococcus depauperatus]